MSNTFKGTGVALVTPFHPDGSIDFPSLEKLVQHVISNGVNYLVALGTTAETPTLSAAEKKEVLAFIIAKAAGKVPVVCGIGGNNTAEVVRQLKEYDLQQVAGILSVVPYYNKPTQEGLYQHFKAIATATDKSIILYNVPGRTVTNMQAATTLRLAHEFKNIVAIKEASGNFAQCMDIIKDKPAHFTVLSGDDDLVLPQISMGIQGVISVAANCFTKEFTSMVNHALQGDFATAQQLHYKLLDGIRLLFVEGNPAGVKTVLAAMNIGNDTLRLPLVNVSEATKNALQQYLKNLS